MATPLKFRALGSKIMKDDKVSRCLVSVQLRAGAPDRPAEAWLPVDMWKTPSLDPVDPWFDDRGVDKFGKPLPPASVPAALAGVGVTSIGPLGSTLRQEVGGVYARHDKFLSWYDDYVFDPQMPDLPWKPDDWFNYELTSYRSANHRYHGYYAIVVALGAEVTLELYDAPGRLRHAKHATVTVKVTDPSQCDFAVEADPQDLRRPESPPEVMLRTDALGLGKAGGVYLNLRHIATTVRGIPKIPIGLEQGLRAKKGRGQRG